MGWFFDDDWGNQNWEEFDAFVILALQFYLDNGLIGGKRQFISLYQTCWFTVGNGELVSVLHRLLEDNVGGEIYRKSFQG